MVDQLAITNAGPAVTRSSWSPAPTRAELLPTGAKKRAVERRRREGQLPPRSGHG